MTAAWVVLMLGAAGAAEPRDRQTVIDELVSATARITLEAGGRVINSGSGVVVAAGLDAAGTAVSYLLTAAHVLEGAPAAEIVVRFTGEAGSRFPAAAVRRGDPEQLDLALLKVTGIQAPTVRLPRDCALRLGEEILVVGFPWGRRLGLYSGVVSQVPVDPRWEAGGEESPSLLVDAAVAKGVSGGGIFRLRSGELIGIVEASQTTTVSVRGKGESYSVKVPMPGETFGVPLARVRAFVEGAPEVARLVPAD
jgi:putative serine protease PepD